MFDVVVPDMGADVEEITLSFWRAEAGDFVEEGSDILEVTTDKANFTIQAPCAGILAEVLANEGETVQVGQIVVRIHEED